MIAKTLAIVLCAAATTFAAPAAPPVAHVTFSALYDDPNVALSTVACSNGPNGLMLKGQYARRHETKEASTDIRI